MTENDFRLARPVSVADLCDIDDRIDRLEALQERMEETIQALLALYKEERIKTWEVILKQMMDGKPRGAKNGQGERENGGGKSSHFKRSL